MSDLLKNLTRRSFIFGGSAALISSGIALGLCSCSGNNLKEGQEADTIYASCAYDFDSLNPVANTNITARSALLHVCEGLYNIDYSNYKTYCGLAAQKPIKINDLSYDVVLRDEVYFSNGKKVTVEDVVSSFKQNMNETKFLSYLNFINDINIKDSKTINFTLKYAYEELLEQRLALVFIFPADQDESSLNVAPIGTGPWIIDNVDFSNSIIEFKVNKGYQGKYNHRKAAMLWQAITNSDKRAHSIINNNSDIIESCPINHIREISSKNAVDYLPGSSASYLMFNCKNKPFDNYKLRQAIFYAIDVGRIIEKNFEGHAVQANSFLPKTHNNYNQAIQIYNYNPELSKKIINELKLNDITLNLAVEDNWVKDFSELIADNLNEIGINVNFVSDSIDSSSYDAALISADPTILFNDADLLLSYWFESEEWMSRKTFWKQADFNKWSELHRFLTRAKESSNLNIKQYSWNQCFDIISINCPIYPLFHVEQVTAYKTDKLSGFNSKSSSGLNFLGTKPK